MSESTKAFDPTRHFMILKGKEYLPVQFRLVWLRSEHPNATIETELVSHHDNEAVFRASVTIPGGGSSTSYGSENARGFGDYLEKAETKSIGRALAALGYGTQFADDFDYPENQPHPQPRQDRAEGTRQQTKPANRGADTTSPNPNAHRANTGDSLTGGMATEHQLGAIRRLAEKHGITTSLAKFMDEALPGTAYMSVDELTQPHAAALIRALQDRKP